MKITVTARGREKSVDSPHTDHQAVNRLMTLVRQGSMDSDFGVSLARQAGSRGLSARQTAWAHVLVVEHDERTSISLPGIAGLLAVARENGAKSPKLTYPAHGANERGTIRFATAGQGSRYCGQIQITDGGPFGDNEYYGRMDPATGTLSGRLPAPVLALLKAIDADPTSFSKVAGWLSSTCCYCNRELTTKASRGAGYGPICAGKYNLPWGLETAQDAPTMADVEVAMRKLAQPLQNALAGLTTSDEQAMYDGEIEAERACGIR